MRSFAGDLMGHNAHVLFEKRLQDGLLDGSLRVAFRRWRRAQVVAGRRYRSPIGLVEIDAVSQILEDEVCHEDALAAGYGSVADLLRDLKGPQDAALFRLELRRSADADPRSVLAEDGLLDDEHLRQLDKKLARLDALRGRSWTRATLEAIEAEPGKRAGDLTPQLGWDELRDFKLHVRKLKALGLTHSLRIGYELSPRGAAYLQRSRR